MNIAVGGVCNKLKRSSWCLVGTVWVIVSRDRTMFETTMAVRTYKLHDSHNSGNTKIFEIKRARKP